MEQILMEVLQNALDHRLEFLTDESHTALRLFNGFSEGMPGLAVDLYGDTLLIHDLNKPVGSWDSHLPEMVDLYREQIPWLNAAVLKTRHAPTREDRSGRLIFGNHPAERIMEHGTWYALDLLMQQDAGFYLDTSNLRKRLMDQLQGKTVLNTFAYTGSLGTAALAGGTIKVTQMDRNKDYLQIAKRSTELNGFPPERSEYLVGDFFRQVAAIKRQGRLFDCVILDPPFFSAGSRSRLDLTREPARLVNKLRPLVADGGWLISINNALFLSGEEYMDSLKELCGDGYLRMGEIIPVPETYCGWTEAPLAEIYPADPTPFNHPTKIVVLKVRRKN